VPVSIVVATCDRPDDLRRCLRALLAQETTRPVEIVVVDNRPESGCTPPVVAEHPGVRLVREPRAGVSYARNAAIVQTAGAIVVSVDDDVTTPPAWLETLLAPLARPDVMVATGPLLPVELETEAQLQFEAYGGLVRGFERREADARWFAASKRAVPTWLLGGTGNAAFRATIFSDPRIGLLDEALGPGTPTGVGEDTYLFYRVLAAGYSVVYEPAAYAWHRHRRTMRALARQIYAYSKGHVAYQLTTLLRDGDYRALARLALELPLAHLWRAQLRVRGHGDYTIALLAIEAAGNLAGPLALWRSRRRVRRLGPSAPYPGPRPAPDAPESGAATRPHEPAT
jgi:GT2 family glycosyltransferase